MNTKFKKSSPYLLILLGLYLLFYRGMAIPSMFCFLIGIVLILERIWPEEWEAEKKKEIESIDKNDKIRNSI